MCSRKETSTPCGFTELKSDLLFWVLPQCKVWVRDRHRWFAQSRAKMRVKRGWRHPKPGSALMDVWVKSCAGVNRVGSAQFVVKPYTGCPVLQGDSYRPAATRNVLHQKETTWNIKSPGLLFGLLEWDSIYFAHTCPLFLNRALTAAALLASACLLLHSHNTSNKMWRGLFLHLLFLHRAVQHWK